MAKHPAPGAVKTRLARRLGPDAASRLYRAFLLDLDAVLTRLGLPVTWAVWPPDAPFGDVVARARCIWQRGSDLGERMRHGVDTLLARGGPPLVVLGADTPHLAPAAVLEAVEALRNRADVVLGPAADGGYYLIGLRAPAPVLFEGIAWGGPDVLADTLARCTAAGLRTHRLAPSFDVDDWGDVVRLHGLVVAGDAVLPHSAPVLAELVAGVA